MANLSIESSRDVLEEVRRFYKAELGKSNIKQFYKDNKFDKIAFGDQCQCGFCNTYFNPFTVSSLKVISEWTWQTEGPEKRYMLSCPQCKEELRFAVFLGQD